NLTAAAFVVSVHGAITIAAAPTGATSVGNTATITTSTPHGLTAGQQIWIQGVSVAGYNTPATQTASNIFTVATVLNPTQFTYTTPGSGLASGGGGYVSPNGGGIVPTVNVSSPDGGRTWVLSFSGAGTHGGSIADGAYDITLNQSLVTYVNSGATLTQS